MSRISPLPVIIIVIILVFSSGCVHTYTRTDLFAAKLYGDGSLSWVQRIDSGQNDVGTGLNETSDGSYLLTGGFYTSICGTNFASPITPYEIRLSSEGNTDSIVKNSGTYNANTPRSGSLNTNGGVSFTTDDGGQLSTYQTVKGGADYYKIQRTDAGGKKLWDKPFLTLRHHSISFTDDSEAIVVQGIVPTSDNGYIVWGYWEKTGLC